MRQWLKIITGVAAALLGGAAIPPNARGDEPVRIVMIGDSTMASYPNPPADRPDLTGWGQVFGEFFNERVQIHNHAASGRSSKSFLAEGRWTKALADRPNYVFIQFGHNDGPGKGDRSTDPNGDFRDNLRKYISESRAAGARPILVTPVARRTFVEGKIVDHLDPYVTAVVVVGTETSTPVVDLHQAAADLFEKLGDAGSADLTASAEDRTHFSRKGAQAMAKLVAEHLPSAESDLAALLRPAGSKGE
jgi:lysophospholipase L1-like esterase